MGGWDDHEAYTGHDDPTRYTTCRYCPQRLPLRDIAQHARTAHPVESLRYTTCWHCKEKFPLNQIRAHGRTCRGVGNQKVGVTVDDLALDEMDGDQNAEPRWSANRLEEVLREGLPDQKGTEQ